MNNEQNFDFTYNAPEQQEVLQIRNKYLPKEESKLDALRALDAKVKRPANVFSYIFGTISAMIMGFGMSLVMNNIGTQLGMTETMVPGIVIGVIGMVMAITNYPMHKKILDSRRKKYAHQIIALSDKLMKG